MKQDIGIQPKNDATNGWSQILPTRAPKPALSGDKHVGWAVVGAGWAGLAAARRLAENCPDEEIALVEAHEVGENASGRNSGFAIDLPHNVGASLEELDSSRAYMRLARAAIAALEEAVTTHGIDCDWSRRGKYHTAVSARGRQEVLEPFAAELEALGEPYQWIEGADLPDKIGTGYYHSSVYTPGCVLMNPAALTRGLADNLPKNVTLYEYSPVTAFEQSNGVTLTLPDGSLRAPRMILTVNGFATQFGFYRNRTFTLAAHASLTRPLDEAERAALSGEDDWGLTPANAFAGITMRFTKDLRLLIRQNIHYQPDFRVPPARLDETKEQHQKLFLGRFPMLPKVTMEHTWTGFLCLSQNHAPGFGMIAPGIYAGRLPKCRRCDQRHHRWNPGGGFGLRARQLLDC